VGWGLRPSTIRARAFAQQHGLPFIALEDGFLRSYGTGDRFPPLSLVVDELGIYYDSTQPSELEALLAGDADVLAGVAGDVARARGLVLRHGLSKYNHAGEGAGDGLLPATQARGRNDGSGGRNDGSGARNDGSGARNDESGARNDGTSLARHCEERSDVAIHGGAEQAPVVRKVLVVDQTFGDMSVALGGATAATFDAMLAAALADNPQATVYV
jgi:capsular polysaccharide export protein